MAESMRPSRRKSRPCERTSCARLSRAATLRLRSSKHRITFGAQIFGEIFLHLCSGFERHGIKMLVEFGQQPYAMSLHYARRFVTISVIFESMVDR